MKWYVYILFSKSGGKTYVGFTSDLDARLLYHNSGRVSFTSRFLPWDLVHFEEFNNESEARKREEYYKSSAGRRKLKRILTDKGLN